MHISNILTEYRANKKAALEAALQEENKKNSFDSNNGITFLGKKRNADPLLTEKKDETDEFLFNSNITLADLGGMDDIVNDIKETIGCPLSYFTLYKYMNIEPVKGILLCGPPGCGKTTIAHAIGGEYNIPFFKIAAPQIISSLSGESENKIRKLFAAVESSAPSILFIDEIESILGKRENASKDMERRIIATITTCIDELGIKSEQKAPIFIIGATSRPEFIDSSVRRSGRFDKEIHIGFPNEIMREKMISTLTKNKILDKDIEFNKLAKITPGYLAADLQSLLREAGRIAIKRILEENQHYCDDLNEEKKKIFNQFLLNLYKFRTDDFLNKSQTETILNDKNPNGILNDNFEVDKIEEESTVEIKQKLQLEMGSELKEININSFTLKMKDFEEV